jgi:hypothetical protein
MLKNIRLHIEKDEEKQVALEEKLAKHISITQRENINAFQRYIPSLLSYVKKAKSQNISIFCNKFSKFNMVDYGLGRAFYGFDPEQEISNQVASFKTHSMYVDLQGQLEESQVELSLQTPHLTVLPAYQRYKQAKSFPNSCDLLVVLGLGLGQHIKQLIEMSCIKHLIIYEPELQYFSCSVMVTAWRDILEIAKEKGTAIYLQLEKDGRDLIYDVMELRSTFPASGFYLYQHYHHPVFNSLYKSFTQNTWSKLVDKGISFKMHEASDEYCPLWSPVNNLALYQELENTDKQYQDNLQAFKTYFPKIHKEFENYKPKKWLPIRKEDGQINILNMENLTAWYSDTPLDDCTLNFDNYSQQPNKDGLVLGYTGEKLKHYIHYQFVKETEELLKDIEEEQGVLPPTIKSLIMFGLGVGYQLEHLMSKHKVEKLFICEPNRDFFYASLFAIDWVSVLKTIDEQEGRLYINIGDDGTNLFRDLLNQFYSIGPYILSQTYFYQSYYNAALSHSISQLREQLQIVISMGEYFDHARYGITHTKEAFMREYPHMVKDAAKKLSFDEKEVPIFLVGNGPSLDQSIAYIKQWQDKAIIVSCGTALQVLYKNGITPDFHAEIEQNRATFDWATRIGDLVYLKGITLISCNGIHPDTCDLYKDVLIAFKEGESSTVSTLNVLGQDAYETLKFAFPTVSNFALNFYIKLGFKQLYLIGIDLGFADNTKHHSTQSGYYSNNGKPLYDYSEKNNTSLVIPGNFRKTVFTKQEFKIAKIIMEQSLSANSVDCYNTSDGAKIIGSLALHLEDIFLSVANEQKQGCLQKIYKQCFVSKNKKYFIEQYDKKYSTSTLFNEISMFRKRLEQPIDTFEQAEYLVESQKRMLFASYQSGHSLLFYFLYGTVNYANVVLNKVAYAFYSGKFNVEKFNDARKVWLKFFEMIFTKVTTKDVEYDASFSFSYERILKLIIPSFVKDKILFVSDSSIGFKSEGLISNLIGEQVNFQTSTFEECFSLSLLNESKYIIFHVKSEFYDFYQKYNVNYSDELYDKRVLFLINEVVPSETIRKKKKNECFFITPFLFSYPKSPHQSNDFHSLHCCILYFLDIGNFDFFIPKYTFCEEFNIDKYIDITTYDEFDFYDLGYVLGAKYSSNNKSQILLSNGVRATYTRTGLDLASITRNKVSVTEWEKIRLQVTDELPFLLENDKYVQ